MTKVIKSTLPEDALLSKYAKHYTDCYFCDLPGEIDLAQFVRTFYKGGLFRMERWILKVSVKRPSTDPQLEDMLAGESQKFAAWTVEDRTDHQLLMCDYQGRTRSWFMVGTINGGTRLYFGSAVTTIERLGKVEKSTPLIFRALMPFHKLYSRLLLGSAARRLTKLS